MYIRPLNAALASRSLFKTYVAHCAVLTFALGLALPLQAVAQHAPAIVPFNVQVTLSPSAAARLSALHEGITVTAYYSGDPAPGFTRHADQMGQINLGAEHVTIAGSGTAVLTGSVIPATQIGWVKDRAIQVLINVYSTRRSSSNNLLDCGIFEDTAKAAAKAPIQIACKLIGEA